MPRARLVLAGFVVIGYQTPRPRCCLGEVLCGLDYVLVGLASVPLWPCLVEAPMLTSVRGPLA